ncbi:methyl-accepting chemotaxis protein [Desulfospira joergensenii]|uniref:methyl-accepting chemotaxis protein n=1 Tax=Desulfospira joergensenii TaxID=53329 RepID=UPI0003B4B97C|nr:methyl-accepting chemotaxis protein [Desulfospira joergensenii]
MNWNTLTIGKKIITGFGVVILLLMILGGLSFTGVGGIVDNAEEVIDGNKLDGNLAQKEVDHLNWVNKVNGLLTDKNIVKLDVETDDHKCGFGKWLYGEGREQAETLVPSLAPLFKEIEKPHKQLHDSAVAIGKVFNQADEGLPTLLTERELDHLNWAAKIRDAFVQKHDTLGVATDPSQCALGKWLKSKAARQVYENGDTDFKNAWDDMVAGHAELHKSAVGIETHLAFEKLAGLEKTRREMDIEFKHLSKILLDELEKGMVNVIDPAKEKASRSGNTAAMDRWSNIDMVMNEQIVQSLLNARLAIHEFEAERTEEKWAAYQDEADKFQAGIDSWQRLCRGEPVLEKIANRLQELKEKWSAKAEIYHGSIMEDKEAEASVQKALEIYNSQTLPLLNKTVGRLQELKKEAEHELHGMREAGRIYAGQTVPALEKVQQLLGDIRKEAKKHIMTDEIMLSAATGTKRNVIVTAVVAIIAGIFLALIIARGIISVLTRITDGLGEGANQVASASTQVSSSSQSMAEGSSQQAASIEETSSSMEEMASMTKKNAENAIHADSLMKESKKVVAGANQSMVQLTRSMEDISKASEETSKIIKTIDEIAFQTNLLALNAAVEAARAGEAGAGFAVVADEVRNLAMRAANAAKDTAELIEGTVKKVNDGSEIVATTNEEFGQVAQSSEKVAQLVAEISEASREQSDGIDQVNKAIAEMDTVVQQNAANAEESASAAEEMNAQAEQLRDYVSELVLMVTGKKEALSLEKPRKSIASLPQSRGKIGKKMLARGSGEVSPDQVIPFDEDEDFKNF